MKITDLVTFEIKDHHISGVNGRFYFFRIIPPNLSILNPSEKRKLIISLQEVLDSNTLPLQILAIDKTEDLTKNRAFWKKKIPERFDFIANDILDHISDIEDTNSGIQRAYYFVIRPQEDAQVELFGSLLAAKSFRYELADREELITIMKNFLLRDFIDFNIYTFEQEIASIYEQQ